MRWGELCYVQAFGLCHPGYRCHRTRGLRCATGWLPHRRDGADGNANSVSRDPCSPEPVANLQELTVYLESETQVGDTVKVTVSRDGDETDVPLTLAERPQQS
jgi:hypothetical protein